MRLEQVEALVKAIDTRHSCRSFQQTKLRKEHLKAITHFIENLPAPFQHRTSFTVHETPPNESVLYFKEPRNFVAFHSSSESVIDKAKLGFLGELLILFCESQGVNTCWMGHYRGEQVEALANPLRQPNDHIFCISPLGYRSTEADVITRLSRRLFSSKRRRVENFLHSESIQVFPGHIGEALRLASLAPSAMNSQKWYYKLSKRDDRYNIEISKPEGYQHFKWRHYDIDVGAAAAHLWLGLALHYDVYLDLLDIGDNSLWRFSVDDDEKSLKSRSIL